MHVSLTLNTMIPNRSRYLRGASDLGANHDQNGSEKHGTCKLGGEEGGLRNSHIISEFLYASMYDDKNRFHVVEAGELHPSYEQDGYQNVRCVSHRCDTSKKVPSSESRHRLSAFKLFQLSTLWRAGVATREFISKVTLGPHEERLMQMLLTDDPGEPWIYGCITIGIHHQGTMVPVIVQPTPVKILNAKVICFTFGGYFW